VTAVVWIVWDVIAFVGSTDATISVVITDFSLYSPILPFIFGALAGHWFWPAQGST